ncbi:MAG: ABC transporter substrate-binding protein, partial [Bacteroidales bacterium]|nr:ABC transporter substrate-binding protein [Bacteroidales bacterium]
PAKIPIENYVEESIVVNQAVAQALGIKIPNKYMTGEKSAAPKKKLKLCFVHYVDSPNSENIEKGVRSELKKQGMTEGKDFTLKVFNAQGDISTLNSIAQTIGSNKWDLIFASSTPTIQMLSKRITDIPIVFSNVGDPVRAGLGKSFTKHLPTITGISTMSNFDGLVKLVIETIPKIKTIGTIYTPGEVNSVAYVEELRQAAHKRGLELIAVPANSATEVADAALSITNRGIQAFTQISDNLTGSSCASIIKAAYNSKIPYFGFVTEQIESGAVAVVARDYFYAGVDAAKLAEKVFSGQSPADIPFQYVTKTSVIVNTKAMNYFGVKIPKKYLKK